MRSYVGGRILIVMMHGMFSLVINQGIIAVRLSRVHCVMVFKFSGRTDVR